MNATITLREYLEKKKCFIIPDYQRGYVWGKNKPGEAKEFTCKRIQNKDEDFHPRSHRL